MSIFRLQITGGPSLSAAVHADMSTDTVWCLGESLDLGDADVMFTADGFPVERGRQVSMDLHVSKGANAGVVMRDIARAISVPDRWLLVQREPSTDPVWFKIHAQSPGQLDIDKAWTDRRGGFFTWSLALSVDSTSVGERAAVPGVGWGASTPILDSGPDRGAVFDVPGEAPTPLRVEVTPDLTFNAVRPLISCFSVPWDSPLLVETPGSAYFSLAAGTRPGGIYEAEEFTKGSTATWSTATTYSPYSGSTNVTGQAAVQPLDSVGTYRTLIRGTVPGTLEPGRYLVLARVYMSTTGANPGVAEVALGVEWASQVAWSPGRLYRPALSNFVGQGSWFPVGYLQHPYGDDGLGMEPGDLIAPSIRLNARTIESGSDSANTFGVDQVAFVPVSLARGANVSVSAAQFRSGVGFGGASFPSSLVVDSEFRRTSVMGTFGKTHSVPAPLRTGGWPVGTPGMATCVNVFFDSTDRPARPANDPMAIYAQADLTVLASPRLLHLGQER